MVRLPQTWNVAGRSKSKDNASKVAKRSLWRLSEVVVGRQGGVGGRKEGTVGRMEVVVGR